MLKDNELDSFQVLGVDVNLLATTQVLDEMDRWINERTGICKYIVATGMHGVLEAHKRPEFRKVVDEASLLVPDGISLVIIGKAKKQNIRKRVTGSDLMWHSCSRAETNGQRMFFYGDTEYTLKQLTSKLKQEFPNLIIAGTLSPPFRALTPDEDEKEVKMINNSGADIIWVGLGLPKQEQWIYHHRNLLNVPVAVGVGAAFKFVSGTVRRAPPWIGESGFEWLWRFVQEPRRVWKRILIDGPHFIWCVVSETLYKKHRKR